MHLKLSSTKTAAICPEGVELNFYAYGIIYYILYYTNIAYLSFTYEPLRCFTAFNIMPLPKLMHVDYTVLPSIIIWLRVAPILEGHGSSSRRPHETAFPCLISCSKPHATDVCWVPDSTFQVVAFCKETSAVFHLTLTVGVPRWEVKGSKWNSAVKSNCGNLGGRWQVGNNQWKVGNNIDWFRYITALFPLLLDMKAMFFPIWSSEYSQIY